MVESFFRRAKDPVVMSAIEGMIGALIDDAAARESIEIVREFALPLQSRALTHLLAVPEAEAETWIEWGVHVFRDGADGKQKGQVLEDYLQQRFDQALREPGEDFLVH